MKTIGLIGGMSWESTATYYRLLNTEIKSKLGGLHSAKVILISVDFAEIEAMQMAGDWQKAGDLLAQAAVSLQSAGADFFLICTNTMHNVAEHVQDAVSIPLLHIADAAGRQLKEKNISTVALLGTSFTMEQDFYKARLRDNYGLKVITPDALSRKVVHDIIYEELCLGVISEDSRAQYLSIIDDLKKQGAQVVILGCTEISLLISAEDASVPLLDTTLVHAQSAAAYSLDSGS